ncbi:MAG TPA: Rid family hydrolase [Ilumatobacteraceae bacterium]|nr:Rid family hydrolase [Ilumatobacteraceae bacterium]
MTRQSIEITSFVHVNPIPAASRIGPLLVSSVIAPRDPGESTVPETPEGQYANLFHHIGQILAGAGADWRHIARITFYVPDVSYRDSCNPIWVEHFPDAESRPARHTQFVANSKVATCEFIAYVDD